MPAYFVTGSGTDVGKTFVAAALLLALRAQGRDCAALKPVVSGFDPERPEGGDPAVLLEALGRPVTPETLAAMSPWRFRAPLSPDRAARLEGRAIDFDALARLCRRAAATASGVLLIEGAGGVMVPLSDARTTLDLMTALRLPLIFVAGSYLGAISHALTGLEAARSRGLAVRAVVVNEGAGASVGLEACAEAIGRFSSAPLALLRRQTLADAAAALAALARVI
ncbi:dethiobiotin synthase [Methylocella sp.]|uniref:dethiobiotin synthase n=1 Tax=Methylocella sp. TaxID=1978226 RepID=UPI003783820B